MSVLIVLQMRLIMQKTLQPDKLRVRLVSVTNPFPLFRPLPCQFKKRSREKHNRGIIKEEESLLCTGP